MTPVLRRACAEDGAALAEVFFDAVMIGAAGNYSLPERQAWAGPCPEPEVWTVRASGGEIWVAEVDRSVLGFAGLSDEQFDLLYVHSSGQRMGLAESLHDFVVNRAHKAGLEKLETFASHTARPFFTARGWQAVASNHVQRRGVWLENTRMVLSIS